MKVLIGITIFMMIAYFIGKHDGKILQERAIYAQFEQNFQSDPGQGIIFPGPVHSSPTYGSLQEKLEDIRAKRTFTETLYDILVSTFFDKEETEIVKNHEKEAQFYRYHDNNGWPKPGHNFGPRSDE